MIGHFLSGDAEQIKLALIQNGLDEELHTYLWREVSLAYHTHHTSMTHWNEDCVKTVLPFIYNNKNQYGLFIDRFAQACATQQTKALIAYCFDYPMSDQALYDLLEYAVQFNDLM